MTDSSSERTEAMADMAGDLISAKMDLAKKDTQMTHVMRIGTFHLELVPDKEIDVREIFNEMLDKLMDKYDEKLLEAVLQHTKGEPDGRHYG